MTDIDVIIVNSARTQSILAIPGEDIRRTNNAAGSIFTFGAFRLESNFSTDSLSSDTRSLKFNSFSTLNDLKITNNFDPIQTFSVQNNELNFKNNDPLSYSYFSSFYSSLADSINNIVESFPYALLAWDQDSGSSVVNYSTSLSGFSTYSHFRIPYSSVTNQGDVFINSGSTEEISLPYDFDLFSIQLSGGTDLFEITSYNYIAPTGSTSYMEFTIKGDLFPGSASTSYTNAVQIRPTKERYNSYLKSLGRLEKQLWLRRGEFLIPNATIPNQYDVRYFEWPTTIDGFNPDLYGDAFESYKDELLLAAELVDQNNTNVMLNSFVPENLLEQDDEFSDMKGFLAVYSKEFDIIKQFIDNIAFAHSINYQQEESVPNKFMAKLGSLLGMELSSSFDEIDMFEYLVGDVTNNSSLGTLNVEIWKRILINIVWLYKKKGTRDALQFIFKLIGAPDCLINLNEYIYEIDKVNITNYIEPTPDNNFNEFGQKFNENGYINYDASYYIFQEGGDGRGDGQKFIDQWRPEFNPIKKVDNVKIRTGSTEFFGTQNIMNTKELDISISPASAIECDVFDWYKVSGGTCWLWGTSAYTFAFSALTTPFEIIPEDCSKLEYGVLSGMTFNQFLEHVYSSFIDPTDRKTAYPGHTSSHYVGLRNLYLYYYYAQTPPSNQLTFRKLEYYISLLEVQFQNYFLQLIPATSIFHGTGTEYRNTIFNRQKFVYKEGINRGSEFQVEYEPPIEAVIETESLTSSINDKYDSSSTIIQVSGYKPTSLRNNMKPIEVVSRFPTRLRSSNTPVQIVSTVSYFTETSVPYI